MLLNKVSIKNFKAIEATDIELAPFTVIVGANGSGKSSVLQSLHWMLQSGRSLSIDTNKDVKKGSTLSEKEATYMPSPDYRNSGNGPEYGNKAGTPQLDLSVKATDENENKIEANMWIKSARNEGLSVHVPANNEFVRKLRDRSQEFSSYIPGLAGIPLDEVKRTKVIVHRQAAAGDANTVLRNILLLLKETEIEGLSGLDYVTTFVSQVMGELELFVEFDEERHSTIHAQFQTLKMKESDQRRRKPLELAGIGFLQVIQIFTYLVYFRPVLLLVDEPDSHLHPATQERLVRVLATAAREFGTQVILSTHSPSVVRALPPEAKVVWMKDGEVQENGDTAGRQMMGWGLLDKRILLLTEDTKTHLIQALLSQWPDLERVVALWPLHGSGKLLDPDGCASLQQLFGDGMKIVLHRDRDFMMPAEATAFTEPYKQRGIEVWLTRSSDLEAFWAEVAVLQEHFGIDAGAAEELLATAVIQGKANAADEQNRNSKRHTIRNQPPLKKIAEKGELATFSDEQVVAEYSQPGPQHVILGKTLCSKIREAAQNLELPGSTGFGKAVPTGLADSLAQDLKQALEAVLQ
ncbi:ATP-binding protein [uncultured Martelella sp.]|uniref:ATP-dependent nuclease n=1 Tax=uncultured Martelella sp. TaxID=392331 RepID=UPI0029C93107|nr:ATP-binding protein [uncultured Martelella sp.]